MARDLARPAELGLAGRGRTLAGLAVGGLLGATIFLIGPADLTLVASLNVFAQTLVVSIAEVAVCFAAIGGSVLVSLSRASTPLRLGMAVLAGAGAFGVYHFAHSPPYNNPELVLMLTQLGLASAAFFFLARDLYGTVVFHNFLAARGVSETLARTGRLEDYMSLRPELLVTALVGLGVLVLSERAMVRASNQFPSLSRLMPSRFIRR